ncbi:MAG: glutathione S-transferase family protein [Syntrophotaleaceae bacterium]
METIELFSARVCPYAHRSRLALMEKGLPFELVEIDLRNKPAWYREINPFESVPALRQGSFLLRESLVINEYVEELTPEPPLLPAVPRQRAEARLWISFADSRMVPLFYRLLKARGEEEKATAGRDLLSVLSCLDEELHRRQGGGPYWGGRSVCLTDLALYPWFERWPVLEHYRGWAIPRDMTALLSWVEAMKGRDAVVRGGQSAEFYIGEYARYAEG